MTGICLHLCTGMPAHTGHVGSFCVCDRHYLLSRWLHPWISLASRAIPTTGHQPPSGSPKRLVSYRRGVNDRSHDELHGMIRWLHIEWPCRFASVAGAVMVVRHRFDTSLISLPWRACFPTASGGALLRRRQHLKTKMECVLGADRIVDHWLILYRTCV